MADSYKTFGCGDGVWVYNNNGWTKFNTLPNVFWRRIRGNAVNDLFVCGDFGHAAHFNGSTWRSFHFLTSGILLSLDVKEDLVVIVGFDGAVGYLITGKRIN